MKLRRCNRTWEASALEDGRLDAAARARFERHVHGCPDCRAEQAALQRLHARARSLPVPAWTELERRRTRADLLRRAHDGASPRRTSFAWLRLAVPGVVVALLAGVFVVSLMARRPAMPRQVLGPPHYEVREVDPASWHKVSADDAHTVIAVSSGRVFFHVEHLADGQTFVVALPDGELEVRGTRFTVHVVHGTTEEVVVTDGLVALRMAGADEVPLARGARWIRASSPASSAGDAPDAAIAAPVPSASGHTSAAAGRSTHPVPKTRTSTYEQAVSAFERGACTDAERLFGRFVRESPNDARCEDAWFLQAACYARHDQPDRAARLASEYLRRYPDGLRRHEAAAIARQSPRR